jgi:hypothetical protein
MSKKDYEIIARAVRDADIPKREKRKIASLLADYLYKDNPRFLTTRFLVACEAWGD